MLDFQSTNFDSNNAILVFKHMILDFRTSIFDFRFQSYGFKFQKYDYNFKIRRQIFVWKKAKKLYL